MELNTIVTAIITGVIMFSIGRFFSSKDKTDDRAEKLEDKSIQDLKASIDEKFGKFEKSLAGHIQSTDKAFDDLEHSNKEINKSLTDLKISYEKVNDKIEGNAKLNEQKFETIKNGLDDLKKTVGGITQVTVKAQRSQKSSQ